MAFVVLLVPPVLAWLVQLAYPERRIMTSDVVSGYFFGVLAGMTALAIAQ